MDRYRCGHCKELAPVLHQVTRARGAVIQARHCAKCGSFWSLQQPVQIGAKIALAEAERAGQTSAFSN